MKNEKNFNKDTQRGKVHFTQDSRLTGNEHLVLTKAIYLHEEGQKFSVSAIQQNCPLGKTAIYTALRKLQEHGYLVIEKKRDGNGHYAAWEYHFYEATEIQEGGEKHDC